jgi:hypothetical protein
MGLFHTRSRLLVSVLAILLGTSLASSASAQGLLGISLPGLSSYGGLSGQVSSSCSPTSTAYGPLTFYAGWGDDRKGTTFSFDAQQLGTDDLTLISQSYPVKGLWLGLAAQGTVVDNLGFLIDGWVLVPANHASEEVISVAGGLSASKTWRARTDWWFVDGALTLLCGPTEFLAGFRYDRFSTNFKDPADFVGILGLPSDRADLTVNSYIPFVGVQLRQGSPFGSNLTFRIIGFPWFVNDMKYHDSIGAFNVIVQDRIQLKRGAVTNYFIEAFAEYGRTIFRDGNIGLFGRWNLFHETTTRVAIDDVFDGEPLTGKYRFALERQSWTLGASFSLAFNAPF